MRAIPPVIRTETHEVSSFINGAAIELADGENEKEDVAARAPETMFERDDERDNCEYRIEGHDCDRYVAALV